jgi:hypothetical protein
MSDAFNEFTLENPSLGGAIYCDWTVELAFENMPELTFQKTIGVAVFGEPRANGGRLNIPEPTRIDVYEHHSSDSLYIWLEARITERGTMELRAEGISHTDMILRVAEFLRICGPGVVLKYSGIPSDNDLKEVPPTSPCNYRPIIMPMYTPVIMVASRPTVHSMGAASNEARAPVADIQGLDFRSPSDPYRWSPNTA